MVMRLSKSARAASHQALEALEELNANMLGIVVNGVGGHGYGESGRYGGKYGGYGYSGYGYSYGYGNYGYGGYDYRYGYSDGNKVYYEDADEDNGNGRHRTARKSSENGRGG
jgi:hypothetical protein